MLQKAKKILLVRFSSLGDILLTTPVVRALKNQFPNLTIDFLLLHQYLDTIKFNPNLNMIYTFFKEEGIAIILDELVSNNYDYIIDLQNNRRSKKIVKQIGVESFSYSKPSLKKFLLVKAKINLLKEKIAIPVRYGKSIPNLVLDNNGAEIFFPKDIIPEFETSDKNIGICPGSRHYTKMWPKEYFIEFSKLLVELGFEPILFGGKDDFEICAEIATKVNSVRNLCNNNNLLQTVANMKSCKIVICNDSGMMHTATAVSVPVLAMFGSTVQEFGFSPYNSGNLILENYSLSCRPCSHIGRNNCPKIHFNCMRSLTPQFVLNEFLKYYNKL